MVSGNEPVKEGEIRAENNLIIKKILASRCYLFI